MTPYVRERIGERIKVLGKKLICILLLVTLYLNGCCVGYIYEYRHSVILEKLLLQPEPDTCALCELAVPYHAPCLVNLSTGEVLELRVYDEGLSLTGYVNQQESGTIDLSVKNGITLMRDTTEKTCTAYLKESKSKIDGSYFCYQCRGLPAQVSTEGYVLADVYDSAAIEIFPLEKGCYTIRDYSVEITDEEDKLKITVTGHIHET